MSLAQDIAELCACEAPAARAKLAWDIVVRHPRAVHFLAKKLYGRTDQDGLSEARIALYDGLLYVNPQKGSVFKVAIWAGARRRTTHLGVHVSHGLAAKMRIWTAKGRDPLDPALDMGGLSDEERLRVAWLVHPWPHEVDSQAPFPFQAKDPDAFTVGPVDERLDMETLMGLLSGMSVRSREALLVDAENGDSLSVVGERHGISRECVRQIRMMRLHELRDYFLKGMSEAPSDDVHA